MRLSTCVLVAASAVLGASACSKSEDPRFYGLRAGQVSSFTSTSDGCAISLLFDDFQASERDPKKTAPIARRFSFVSSVGAAGKPIHFDIRGAALNVPKSTISVRVGLSTQQFRPSGDNFTISGIARLSGDAATTPVEVSVNPNFGEDEAVTDKLLAIDSIDVSMPACGNKASKEQ